mgnify:CR=1 FL=1
MPAGDPLLAKDGAPAVAGVGDTDADGVNDFVVTADKQDSGGTDAGACTVASCSSSDARRHRAVHA